jgi:sec-independent protein translocase protein TatA
MGLGTGEIILIVVVVMFVFGASKLPQLGDALGRAIGNFKRTLGSANEIVTSAKKPDSDGTAQPDKQASAKPADKS